jgi:predicted ester cyclase
MKPQTSIVTRPAWGQGHLSGNCWPEIYLQAAGELIRYVHETAFDARPELKNLLVDTGKAAIEADFAGTHTGEFAGIQPTGRAVRVPYSVIYDLRDDQISALRIYFPMSLLIEQLTS